MAATLTIYDETTSGQRTNERRLDFLTDRINRVVNERNLRFQRGTGTDTRVEFDSAWGTYKISMSRVKVSTVEIGV